MYLEDEIYCFYGEMHFFVSFMKLKKKIKYSQFDFPFMKWENWIGLENKIYFFYHLRHL